MLRIASFRSLSIICLTLLSLKAEAQVANFQLVDNYSGINPDANKTLVSTGISSRSFSHLSFSALAQPP